MPANVQIVKSFYIVLPGRMLKLSPLHNKRQMGLVVLRTGRLPAILDFFWDLGQRIIFGLFFVRRVPSYVH